jgi:cell wall-associated NlpC family hydrolase
MFIKITNKHYFLTIFISLLIMGCVSQPRYTSYPIETKSPSPLEEKDESKKETLSLEEESKTKIDQVKMAQIIESFLGTPYAKGGASKKGMDCSGFVVEVYKRYARFNLPHNTEKLFKLVKKVDKERLGYGDLIFFSDFGFSPSHVGIYIGEGEFVHSTKGYGVIVSSLEEERYRKSYIGARRVIP